MATLDQLPAEQRAIIELVLQRGQSYDELSEMLGMPATRVRELARDALYELSPRTAERVDEDWRAQLSDYLLGQQSGPEAIATRGHLKRSEPARTWALSLMDSLDGLYANGTQPVIPDEDGGATETRERPKRRERAQEQAEEKPERKRDKAPPSARTVVLRRRILAAVAGLALVGILVFVVIKPFGGDDDDGGEPAQANEANQTLVLHQALLRAQRGEEGAGIAVIGRTQGQLAIQVTGSSLRPTNRNQAYAVWLYNSREESRLVAAQVTDEQGRFVAVGPVPDDYTKYRNIDVSRQNIRGRTTHSGDSVLRGRIQAIPEEQQRQPAPDQQQQEQQPQPEQPAPEGEQQP
jgi:hypothetical protein